ncbi:MAG: hypothetical protein AB7E55_24385 [Pigmentiphaga sp.]
MRYEIEILVSLPLCSIYRLRKTFRRLGRADLVALADAAAERRIAIVCGETRA